MTVNVSLKAGENTLKFYTTAAGVWAPDLDRIVFGTEYEAEASGNTLAGGAAASYCAICSGSNDVKNVGNVGGTLQFNSVAASSAGTRSVTIYYINGDTTARTSLISVNGGTGTSVSFPSTGSWSTVGTVTINLSLSAGSNSLKFYTTAAGVWAPDIDKIAVL